MRVTDLDYVLENRLVEKLDLMIERCTNPDVRKDAVLEIEGSEGEGKTNTSETIAYYVKFKTGRQIHMFFRLKELIDFAQKTENMIIIWDEPALDSLSTDWYKEVSKDLMRLLMTCRKKRHFLIFNFVKFYKFSEYIVVDRAIGMVHMYTRKNIHPGRFIYVKKSNLENLYNDYQRKKKRNYKMYMAFGGKMPVVEHLIDKMGITIEGKENATMADYESLKDKAILSIGEEKKKDNPAVKKLKLLQSGLTKLSFPVNSVSDFMKQLGMNRKTFYDWAKIDTNIVESPPVE